MTANELKNRVDALVSALDKADAWGNLVLRDITPEQLAMAYPTSKITTFVSRDADGVSTVVDSAKVPHAPNIRAQRHRAPTSDELAEVKAQPYDTTTQHFFHGSEG